MAYIKDVQVGSDTYLIEPTLYIAPTKNGAAYTATLTNFSLVTGATVQAKFATTNNENATLNINSTGAKEIHYNGDKITANQFKVNHVYTLVYDGTQWQVVGDIDTNTNTWRGIQDNLTSDSTTESLSAKQGKVLKGLIDAMDASTPAASGNATAFIDSITQTDGKITSITKKNIPTVSSSTAGLAPKGAAVSTQSTSTKFLREDGTWAAPSYITNTDAKVAQSSNTEDKEFPIILKNTNNATNETNGVKYDGDVTVNPSESKITATTIQANSRLVASKAISQIITGTGTAGSYTNSTYHPAKWTFNTGLTATDGDIFTIKIPVAGHDYGVFMSVDNGSHYYPVVLNGTGRITTHYPVNTYLTVIFEPTGSAASMYAVAGQTSSTRVTVTGGVWRVLNYYDSNSNDTGYYHRRIYPNLKAGTGSVDKYTIIMQLPNGRWSSIVQAPSWTTNSSGSVIPKDTGKSASTNGFMLGHVLLMYANATYADGANIGTYNIWSAHSGLIDARYSFNLANSTGNGFVAYTPVYIVGTVSDGLFHLDTTKWWTQTLPSSDDGKVYIYIGDAYDWYRLTFTEDKPIYWYKNGAIRLYSGASEYALSAPLSGISGADDLKAIEAISDTSGLLKKTAANTWTLDTNNYVTSSGITSVTIGATSPVQSSTSTAQTGSSASTTISLKDAYGDTKNPYGTKAKNLVLAGPSSGSNAAPTFRALVAADIPNSILKWQTTTAESTALYDFGVYVNMNNANGSSMKGGDYFNILNVPYRKASGNTKADWGWQLGNTTSNDGRLWYRTAGDNVWGDWQTIAHATQSTSNIGSATQPVYMTAAGVITAGTELKALAYKDSLTSSDIPDNAANTTGNAATATNAANTQSNYGAKSFIVEGNADTYYPVIISEYTSHGAWTLLNISRDYAEQAPDTWNTSTHKGGLVLTILSNGNSTWGGNHSIGIDKLNTIIDLSQSYCTMVADMQVTSFGLVIWLRGGSARYWITSNGGQSVTATPKYEEYTANSNTIAPCTDINTARLNDFRWNNLWTIKNATNATIATNLANKPSIQTASSSNQITITTGGKTSDAFTVPYAGSANTATYIKCIDTRSAALDPTDLKAVEGVRFDFKAKETINLTATDNYAGVMSFRPYASNSDWSGGNAHQIAFNSEGLHWRNGSASWGNWYQILDSNNTAAGSNNAATLAWNTTYIIAKINGTDIKFTTMAKPSYAFTDLTEHPTTLNGYGITDAASSSHSHTLKIGNKSLSVSTSEQEWNVHDILYNSDHNIGTNTSWDITEPGVYSVASSGAFTGEQHPSSNGNQSAPYTYGHAFTIRANNGGASQFYINHNASESKHSSRGIRYRSGWNVINNPDANHWKPWATILDDKNFNLYAPTLTGTGASGSWGISITGTAAKATADASGNTITSTYATKTEMNGLLAAANAMTFKGTLGTEGTITELPASHEAGDTYRVITAGTWAGQYCEEGTLIICVKDGAVASNDDWTSVETNEDGAVIGPSAATDNGIVLFSGNTGRIIKNSSKTLTTTAPSTDSGDTTIPTSKAVWTTVNTAITGLDFTAVGGDTGEYISKISQTDGKISATKATTSVSNTWAAGTTAGPTIKTTVNGITGTAVAIPSASNTASGVITTGEQTFAGIKTFANTTASTSTDTGAVLIGGGLGVAGQVTAVRLAANGSNTSYNLYVNGTSLLNGNTTVNGNLIPGENNTKTLGSTSARWSKLYIGTADTHGDTYTPVYWNDGVPATVTPIQYCTFTIGSGKKGVKLTHAAFTAASYVTQIVVTDGESNLNSAIAWESAAGYINLTCSAVTSGAVNGYILVSRGGAVTATATDIT